MALELVCNFKKCRKSLPSQAWVTSCSHAFCKDHGLEEFSRNDTDLLKCPACGSELKDKFDVIRADLTPSETFKSIVLAGMKPDMIMDIAMRAMSFWTYQVEQESRYHESVANYAKEKVHCLEEVNALNLSKYKAALQTTKRKWETLQSEYIQNKKKTEELIACIEEKNRKIQKLSFQMETLRRKPVNMISDPEAKSRWNNMEDIIIGDRNMQKFVFQPGSATPRHVGQKHLQQAFNAQRDKRRQNIDQNFKFNPVIHSTNEQRFSQTTSC